MRRNLLLFALTALVFASPAAASSQTQAQTPKPQTAAQPQIQNAKTDAASGVRGSLPGDKKAAPPEPTEEQIAEANSVRAHCEASDVMKGMYDCDCMAINVLQYRAEEKVTGAPPIDIAILRDKARLSCANRVGLAGKSYTYCQGWAPRRMNDYEPFCACFANAYSTRFAAAPSSTRLEHKNIIKGALRDCNAGEATLARMNRLREIRNMKENGTYKQMFPSAKNATPRTKQKSGPTGQPPTPGQILSEKLFPSKSD